MPWFARLDGVPSLRIALPQLTELDIEKRLTWLVLVAREPLLHLGPRLGGGGALRLFALVVELLLQE